MDLSKHSTAQPITCQPLHKQYVKTSNHLVVTMKLCLFFLCHSVQANTPDTESMQVKSSEKHP